MDHYCTSYVWGSGINTGDQRLHQGGGGICKGIGSIVFSLFIIFFVIWQSHINLKVGSQILHQVE